MNDLALLPMLYSNKTTYNLCDIIIHKLLEWHLGVQEIYYRLIRYLNTNLSKKCDFLKAAMFIFVIFLR